MSQSPLTDAQAFAELEAIYRRAEADLAGLGRDCAACGACCRFGEYDHVLLCTSLEAAYLRHVHGSPPAPTTAAGCGYQRGAPCTARAGRPLACRTFLCAPLAGAAAEARRRAHEAAHRQVAALCDRWSGGYRYGRIWQMD